ncbi:MAG: hypothetical protein WED34_13665 [Planctomycetales bacterium]
MIPPTRLAAILFVLAGIVVPVGRAEAQGLIWSLPADGTWVRYEGTYEQTVHSADPTSAMPQTKLTWLRKTEIKSVGREDAEYAGQATPCRWVEIKTVTGKANPDFPLGIDPGPAGTRVYKVLIPESRVLGKTVDEAGIPVTFLPIVMGHQKIGDGPVQALGGGVLQVYPSLTLLQHYPAIEPQSAQPEDAQIRFAGGPVAAVRHVASHTSEGPTNRTANEAEFWISGDVPFGLAKWDVGLTRMEKDAAQPRGAFRLASESRERMEARQTGTDAKNEAPSEIAVP